MVFRSVKIVCMIYNNHGSISSCCCVSGSFVSDCLQPHGLQPTRLLYPWSSPGKNTGVGCHSLLQMIFLTQRQNPGLLHCRQILYLLRCQVSPYFIIHLSKSIACTTARMNCNANYGFGTIMKCQCRFVSCSMFLQPTLVGDAENGGGYMGGGV